MQKMLFSLFFLLTVCTAVFAQQGASTPPMVLVTAKGDTLKNNNDSIYIRVQVESDFPGGQKAWGKYIERHLDYPRQAERQQIQGVVAIRFIISSDGSVCNPEVAWGPELLRKAALDVIKKSPKWIPAQKDGKAVNSYKMQPVIFKLRRPDPQTAPADDSFNKF